VGERRAAVAAEHPTRAAGIINQSLHHFVCTL